jgi:hypothetical protein
MLGIAGDGGRVGALFVKAVDAAFAARFDHAEFGGQTLLDRDCCDRDLGALMLVKLHHAGDVHAVDVVGAEDGNQVRVGLLDEVDVLKDGVGRSLVPGFISGAHLRRHRDDELVFEEAAELPALAQVLQ